MVATAAGNRPRCLHQTAVEQRTRGRSPGLLRTSETMRALLLVVLLGVAGSLFAQPALPALSPQPAFPLHAAQDPLVIDREVMPLRPFSVVGSRGAVLGQQDGSFEIWLFPWKILSGVRIGAQMENYPVPIDVNQHASTIEVRPYATILTFSHANFTLREIILAPRQSADGAGALVFYQIEAMRPMTLTFSFTPNMQRMWPAESDVRPSPEWIATSPSSGFYMLHLNFPDNAAAVAMPTASRASSCHTGTHRLLSHAVRPPLRSCSRCRQALPHAGRTRQHSCQASTREALSRQLAAYDASVRSFMNKPGLLRELLASSMSIDTPDPA